MIDETDDNVVPFPTKVPTDVGPVDVDDLPAALEALLFAAGEPVTLTELVEALGLLEPDPVRDALHQLAQDTVARGIRVVKVADGWQMRTDARFSDAILRLRGGRPQTMSKAALEALAVVAYRQPVTRSEIEDVRGVKSGGVLKTLLDKGYVRVSGRRDEPGRPMEFRTTPLFLEMFELSGLEALPTLEEREALAEEDEDARIEIPEDELAGDDDVSDEVSDDVSDAVFGDVPDDAWDGADLDSEE